VQVGFQLVELEAATKAQVPQAVGFDANLQGHHVRGRGRIAKLRLDFDRAEDFEVQQGARGVLDGLCRVGLALRDVDGAP
jgi:hypothetical protein